MTRIFETKPAQRTQVNMIIGLVSPSSGGKTYSALELATGMQQVTGGDIEMIDTEHGRGLFYADKFKFNHTPFEAPYSSLDYLDAIQQADKRSKIIIVDSFSHEHEGEGGMLDYQEKELTRLAGNDYRRREIMQMLAWDKPKADRRKLRQGITKLNAHLILCFRAKNTSKPMKGADGKTKVINMGFVPIGGDEFVFEAALSMLFYPNSHGVPIWEPELPGERIAVKLPDQFQWLAKKTGPITRADGKRLAEWAAGAEPAAQPPAPRSELPSQLVRSPEAQEQIRKALEAMADIPIGGPESAPPNVFSEELKIWRDMFEFGIDTAADFESFGPWMRENLNSEPAKELYQIDLAEWERLREKGLAKHRELKQG